LPLFTEVLRETVRKGFEWGLNYIYWLVHNSKTVPLCSVLSTRRALV
jgi:hypothetical protein